jgi:hypothetical protein
MNAICSAPYSATAVVELVDRSASSEALAIQPQPRWGLATRIAFRFVFSYFMLFAGLQPLALVPGLGYLVGKYEEFMERVVLWFATHILRISITISSVPNGSGDTTSDYIQVFTYLLIAAFITLVWSVLDRKRYNYARLHQWLRLDVTLVLGLAMLSYGAMKVIPAQMPAPYLSRLLETYGDSSPMGLLWTFIGASKWYETFCGAAEMLGGILLFIPALATLGALLSVAVMGNVFMLNMCFDVPVKLYSLHLLLMAIFLATPELRRLAEFFIFHRTTNLSVATPLFRRKWLNRAVLVLQLLAAFGYATLALYGSHQQNEQAAIKPPHYGIWTVEEYSVDGKVLPPSLSEANRWRRVILDHPERLTVQYVDSPQERFFLKQDRDKSSVTLNRRGDPNWKSELFYHEVDPDTIELQGKFDSHQMHARLHSVGESKFLLTSRGFHWINEYPNNR